MVRPEDLRLFLRVAALGSFSRAAREAGILPGQVSAAIQRLEAALIECGHYIPEEAPTALVRSLSDFYARYPHG